MGALELLVRLTELPATETTKLSRPPRQRKAATYRGQARPAGCSDDGIAVRESAQWMSE